MNLSIKTISKKVITLFTGSILGLCVSPCLSTEVVITFDDLRSLGEIASYGFDYNNDGVNDLVFSTTDPDGFNDSGPGLNMSYIDEPGLEGTTTLVPDLRVDFTEGVVNNISFTFALSTSSGNFYGVLFKVFASDGNLLAQEYQLADFTYPIELGDTAVSNPQNPDSISYQSTEAWPVSPTPQSLDEPYPSDFPEAIVKIDFSGRASYATFDFDYGENEPSRYIIDDFTILSVELIDFSADAKEYGIQLDWSTGAENNNGGFRIRRATKDQDGSYRSVILGELDDPEPVSPGFNEDCSTKIQGQLEISDFSQSPRLISAIGNPIDSTCYSFTDTSNLSDGTYYYLLEDIDDDDGKSTFHCDHIDVVTIGQGPPVDLQSAIDYCKKVTGSED